MQTLALSNNQEALLREMAKNGIPQVVLRIPKDQDPIKKVSFDTLNKEVDEMLEAGLITDISKAFPNPEKLYGPFRVIGITWDGVLLFNGDPAKV